jgi:transcription antitermination factor NusG
MTKNHSHKRVKKISATTEIIRNIPYFQKFISSPNDPIELSPTDIQSLKTITLQLGNDYRTISKNGNSVDIINFEIRCTNIIRTFLAAVR